MHLDIYDPYLKDFVRDGEFGRTVLTSLLPVGGKCGTLLLNYDTEDTSVVITRRQCGSAINGGLMKRKQPINSPLFIIGVQKIDDAMKKVEKMGGKIIKGKLEVEDMDYSAYFKDTEGNIIGLWEAIR